MGETIIDSQRSRYFNIPTNVPVNKRGRPKGALNKIGSDIRWGICEAYRRNGGVEWMTQWAKKNPDAFFVQVLPKVLPMELAESGSGQSIRILVYAPQQSPSDKPVVLADSASMQLIEAAEQAAANETV